MAEQRHREVDLGVRENREECIGRMIIIKVGE